ncbi:MAG TPA: hypothetical protein GXX46_09730 [Peptococcaceae bacterium]|nr:hypothetical protein [Peptococcaceae bacterium]
MAQKLLGRIFPFIPLGIGLLLIFLQLKLGKTGDNQTSLRMTFVLITSCLVSWLFATAGLLIYRETLFTYYKQLFQILSVIYLVPAIILALFIPWSLILNLAIFITGIVIIHRIGWKYK